MDKNELTQLLKKLCDFYGNPQTYFEQPTLSGYKKAPISNDEGKLARAIQSQLEEDCSDSKGAYP